jgi:hypothetical protein
MIDFVLVAQIVGGIIASLYIAQTYYLAVMSLARAKALGLIVPGTWQSVWFALWLAPGVLLDWFLNFTLFIVFFLELPETWGELITGRLKRHCGKPTWRGKFATWICHGFLDKFDPRGRHC